MGYSPGEFECRRRSMGVHWELKDGPRVVLWDPLEKEYLLDLDLENFRKAYSQMRTLAIMLEID